MNKTVVVVPCYNEASRLAVAEFASWAGRDGIHFLFVDDGSTDGTREVLESMQARSPAAVMQFRLDRNVGKAEAVRQGLLRALEMKPEFVGYLDADLATPIGELLDMRQEMDRAGATVALGARVALLGRRIQRSMFRHYSGRIFATLVSWLLGLVVYDTQCGAKLFRDTVPLRTALNRPFISRWAFDVELIGRLLVGTPEVPPISPTSMVEYPLHTWVDVRGSKLNMIGMVLATAQLILIWRDIRKQRRLARYRFAPRG